MRRVLCGALLLVGLTACQQDAQSTEPAFTNPDRYPSAIMAHLDAVPVETSFGEYLVNGAQCSLLLVLTTTADIEQWEVNSPVATNPQRTVGVVIEETDERQRVCFDAITEALSDYTTEEG